MFVKKLAWRTISIASANAVACNLISRNSEEDNKRILNMKHGQVRAYLKSIQCSEKKSDEIINRLSEDKQNCLIRLATEDKPLPQEVTFDVLWKSFTEKVPDWQHNSSTCVKFWEKYPHLEFLKVVKLQGDGNCGTCHAQAPVVLQHYVVTIDRNEPGVNFGMMSVPSLMRHLIDKCSKLEEFLNEEYEGGFALKNLMTICQLGKSDITGFSVDALRDKQVVCNFLMNRLKTHPALIAVFDVSTDFIASDQLTYGSATDIMQAQEAEECHSMVLVGIRQDQDGQYWFLCQNWWPHKPFIEVSYEYMIAAGVYIAFIDKTQFEIPRIPGLKVTKNLALSTAVDKGVNNAPGPALKK